MLWRGVGIHNTRSMTWLLKALMKARASQLSQPCGIHYVAALIFGVALTRDGFPSTTATGALYPISVSATRLSSLAHHVLCSLVVPPVVAQGKLRAERTRRARRCACPRRQHPLACPLDRKSPCLRGHGSAPLPQRCLPVHANTLSAHAMPPRAQPRALHAQAPDRSGCGWEPVASGSTTSSMGSGLTVTFALRSLRSCLTNSCLGASDATAAASRSADGSSYFLMSARGACPRWQS